MRITRIFIAVLVACVLTGLGCAKGPAEQAVKAADEALAAAQPDVQPYVPDQWRMLNEAVEAAHADFEKGSYKAALDAAKAIPGRIDEAKTMAQARKDELAMFWQQMGSIVPMLLTTMGTKVSEGKIPPGMTREQFEAAKAEMANLVGLWSEAEAAYNSGKVAEATEMGAQVQGRAESLLAKMGVKPGVLPAPGAKPAAPAAAPATAPAGTETPAPGSP